MEGAASRCAACPCAPGSSEQIQLTLLERHRCWQVADVLKKEETKKAVSSIKSKLSAPKVAGSSLEDKRKRRHGTFSASLSREQILASQARHEEKMRALGKPVPVYSAPRK